MSTFSQKQAAIRPESPCFSKETSLIDESRTDLAEADLAEADLAEADLAEADLAEADLAGGRPGGGPIQVAAGSVGAGRGAAPHRAGERLTALAVVAEPAKARRGRRQQHHAVRAGPVEPAGNGRVQIGAVLGVQQANPVKFCVNARAAVGQGEHQGGGRAVA